MIPVVILSGGMGTRLREMTEFLPKPLIPIGGIPIIVHIMKLYSHYGFKNFVLALGHKQEMFKQYFAHYDLINNDCTILKGRYMSGNCNDSYGNSWNVTMVDTGENTMKGGRLKRVEKYIKEDTFMCTYGDGLSDINLQKLLSFHQSHGKIATITGVHPIPRFGEIHREESKVISFSEKPQNDDCLISGGYMVFNRKVFDYLTEDVWCDLEIGPLELLAAKGELQVYHHKGYWQCLDTMKDMGEIQKEWETGRARWKVEK